MSRDGLRYALEQAEAALRWIAEKAFDRFGEFAETEADAIKAALERDSKDDQA